MPRLVAILMAWAWWQVFQPGIMSYDSFVQYQQALDGKFTDEHPPIMAIVLRQFFQNGYGIRELMLGQAIFAMLGVFELAYVVSKLVTQNRLGSWGNSGAALLTALVLQVPISPFVHHMMSWWKDIWLMIAFLWLITFWLWACIVPANGLRFVVAMLGLLHCSTMAILSRHNSLTILPVVTLMFGWLGYRRAGWRLGVIALIVPYLTLFLANSAIRNAYEVKHVPVERWVYVADFAAIFYHFPELIEEYPIVSSHLSPNFREVFYLGQSDRFGPCYQPTAAKVETDQLRAEYQRMAQEQSKKLLWIKYRKLLVHLEANECLRFHNDVSANPYGLKFHKSYAERRTQLTTTLWVCFITPFLRWPFLHHGVWLVLNLALLLGLSLRAMILRGRGMKYVMALLIPLAYFAAYFVASVSSDFRYMYPSSLMLQVGLLAVIFGPMMLGIQQIIRRRDESPNLPNPP